MNISFSDTGFDWINPLINIVAVLMGSGLAWMASYFFEKKKQDQTDLATGYSLMFKVQEFADEITQLEKAVGDSYSGAQAEGVEGPAWTKLNNIVGFNRIANPVFSEELALIARTKNHQLVMDVRELESGHRILKSVLHEISSLKTNLEAMNLGRSVEGKVVTFGIGKAEFPSVAPTLIGLNELSEHLDKILPRISEHARQTATELGPFLKKSYKFSHFISLSFSDGVEQTQVGSK